MTADDDEWDGGDMSKQWDHCCFRSLATGGENKMSSSNAGVVLMMCVMNRLDRTRCNASGDGGGWTHGRT